MPIRVMLVDDHDVVRSGCQHLLDSEPDIEVVAEARDGRAAIELAPRSDLDLVIMDVSMPDLNGILATQRIIADCPGVRVLALSMHPAQQVVDDMIRAGASGYVVKTNTLEELVEAVRTVHGGKTYLSPGLAATNTAASSPHRTGAKTNRLTAREQEVLQLVAEGKTSKEIGAALHVSPKTIGAHRDNIMTKLRLRSVAELTKYAIREGLTPLD